MTTTRKMKFAIVWILVWLLLAVSAVAYVKAAEKTALRSASFSRLKMISIAHEIYTSDFDGYGPAPDSWADKLKSYCKDEYVFHSPHIGGAHDEDRDEFGYAYYRPLGGLSLDKVQSPAEVPLIFDSSDMRWNANGDLSLLPDPPRWDGKNLLAFLDGHVAQVEGTPKVEIKLP